MGLKQKTSLLLCLTLAACGSKKDKDAPSPTPPSPTAPQPAQPAGPGPASTTSFTAEILNKGLVAADGTVGQRTMTLQFGIAGTGVTAADVWFECRREGLTEFRRCPQGAAYEFSELRDGASYSLTVRAVHRATNAASPETTVSFVAKPARLTIRGLEALRSKSAGSVTLGFDPQEVRNKRVSCTLDQLAPVDCAQAYSLNFDGLTRGSHRLYVEARDQRNSVTGSEFINFCAGACSLPEDGSGATAPVSQTALLIGGSYEFHVPPEMHLTEYATINTYNGALSFLRIMDDPHYVGLYHCDQMFDRVVSVGENLFCHSTPTQDLYKWMVDSRISFNHLEVATTSPSPQNHRRITLNLFDERGKFMQGHSRFDQLCAASRGTVKASPKIPVAVDFWGEKVDSVVYTCRSYLPSGFSAANRDQDTWWVGGVFITTEGTTLPSAACFQTDWRSNAGCSVYQNPQMLEVVFMSQGVDLPEVEFVRLMQAVVQDTLRQVVPRQ